MQRCPRRTLNPAASEAPRTAPAGLLVARRSHTPITDCIDSPGPECPDLALRAHLGLTWTPTDGLYNLCQVVPSDGARISTGASSGPSKRYCRVFVTLSLTPCTLSHHPHSHMPGA
ncbi:hypothetical protein Stsp02_32880 [Streptomyces sp. NBRC 14336]|nr:hypothetical protein Stsp02_32880 [Streptomyces sp. NBRC 14336]